MNGLTGSGHPNGIDQNGCKWDELDQRFWDFYKTIDENKMWRSVRWFAGLSFVLALSLYASGICILVFTRFEPGMALLALFIFGLATLNSYLARRELTIWNPEKATD